MRARALILLAAVAGAFGAATVAQAAFTDGAATTHATFGAAAEFPPVLQKLPVVLGAPQWNLVLSATAGTFSPAPTTSTYAWQRCDAAGANCAAIAGATAATYTPGSADVGKTLRFDTTPVNGSTPGTTVRSEPTAPVLGLLAGPSLQAPVATSTPTITGTATVGQTLGSAVGTWVQLLATASYKWMRCDPTGAGCTAIPGATNATYTLVVADRGTRVMLAVTANVLNLVSATANTDTTGVVL